MSIFNVNFSQVWKDLTPPILRESKALAWGNTLVKPLQYLRDIIFQDYVNGSIYNNFAPTSAYTASTRVIWNDRAVYENISGSTGIYPNDVYTWRKINDNYIGAIERSKYSAQLMVYEYALNRWFQCTGIYIYRTPVASRTFWMGNSGIYSSTLSNSSYMSATTVSYMSNVPIIVTTSYTIYVPNAVFNSLATTYLNSVKIVRNFADTINLAGLQYSVSGY